MLVVFLIFKQICRHCLSPNILPTTSGTQEQQVCALLHSLPLKTWYVCSVEIFSFKFDFIDISEKCVPLLSNSTTKRLIKLFRIRGELIFKECTLLLKKQ